MSDFMETVETQQTGIFIEDPLTDVFAMQIHAQHCGGVRPEPGEPLSHFAMGLLEILFPLFGSEVSGFLVFYCTIGLLASPFPSAHGPKPPAQTHICQGAAGALGSQSMGDGAHASREGTSGRPKSR